MSDGASNHSSIFQRLRGKGLRAVDFREQPPESAESSVETIQEILGIRNNTVTPTKVKEALGKAYKRETDFDEALFSALRDDLKAMGMKVTDLDENKMVIEPKTKTKKLQTLHFDKESYAFGFARQARRKTNKPHASNPDISPAVNVIGAKHLNCDHTCCVFKKNKGKEDWNIEAIFAVVELKMSDKSSECDENLLQNDPIIQAICYVIEHVWPDSCTFGLIGSEKESLPIALIAAKKEKTTPTHPFKRLVKGSLLLPSMWGDDFKVESNFFEHFVKPVEQKMTSISENPKGDGDGDGENFGMDEDDDSGDKMQIDSDDNDDNETKNATNLYMEIILGGISLLRQCYCMMVQNKGKLPFPSPVSGFPPKRFLDPSNRYDHCGSPVLSLEDLKQFQDPQKPKYYISQGDLHLFESLDLSIFDDDYVNVKWLVDTSSLANVTNVFVKVWSKTAHRSLQDVDTYEIAYTDIFHNGTPELKESLSEVLIGAVFGSSAASTITRKIEGSVVKPTTVKDKRELKSYWKLFSDLCKDVLLPLADIGIVHQDLRPGHDCTYNVMIGTTEKNATRKMRLIDYESLCRVIKYNRPPSHKEGRAFDYRYPSRLIRKGKLFPWAHDFLFEQCVGIAYAWIERKPAKEMNFTDATTWFWLKLPQDVKNGKKDAKEWWFSSMTTKKDAERVFGELLRHIDGMFDDNHGTTTRQSKTKDAGSVSATTAATEVTTGSSKYSQLTP